MKKLIILAVAAVFAVVANANSVTWNTGAIYGPGDGGTGFSDDPIAPGSTGYLATLYVFTDAAMTSTSAVDLQSGYSSSTVTADSTIEGTTADIAALTEGTYYAYMTIIDPSGKELKSAGFSFEVSDMLGGAEIVIGEGGDGITAISGSLDDDYGAFSPTSAWGGGGTGGIPEPTSGLLLVLGGAMLALRRKRA